jgi:hypothetical protein
MNPLDTLPAIFIVADEWTIDSPRLWQSVVEEVKKYVDGSVVETPEAKNVDISVEMVAENLVREKYLSLLDNDATYPYVKEAWPCIKERIFGILESFSATVGHMTAIALFKLGPGRCNNNPKTVYISVGYESPESGWPPVVEKMQSFLDEFKLGLRAHMEHNIMGPRVFHLQETNLTQAERLEKIRDFGVQPMNPYSISPSAGAGIGAGRYLQSPDGKLSSPILGTLGCWLDVNVKGEGWKAVALTNYHIVRPALDGFTLGEPIQGSDLWNADADGLLPSDVEHRGYKMERPARAHHNFTVETTERAFLPGYTSQDPSPTRDRYRQILGEQIEFIHGDRQYFGQVWLASGFMQRTTTSGRLDWALVMPMAEDRIGANILPGKGDWAVNYTPAAWAPCPTWGATLQPQAVSIHDMQRDDLMYKVGASTKCTIGEFTEIRPECTITEERYMPGRTAASRRSTEFMFAGAEIQPFEERGDSGAVVWDREGRVVGLLFRGQAPHQCGRGYALVTPIEDVFESIIAMSKGIIVGVRLAGDERH